MSRIIDKAREKSEEIEELEAKKKEEENSKRRVFEDRLEELKKYIVSEITKMDGKKTKHGKFHCTAEAYGDDILRVFCDKILVFILRAGIVTYEDNQEDGCLRKITEPIISARIFRTFGSRDDNVKVIQTHYPWRDGCADRFLDELGVELAEMGWV